MSSAPAQTKHYERHVFDPDQPTQPGCPLCWNNGLLKGGRVLVKSELFFVYVFENPDGSLKDNFIAPKLHHPDMTSLPLNWGQEFGEFYAALLHTYGIGAHNGYWNEGHAAGQRITGHWHVRVSPAPMPGDPSYGMGLALLRQEYAKLATGQ